MTLTKTKVGIIAAIITLLVMTPVIVQQRQAIAQLQKENTVLSEQVAKATEARDEEKKVQEQAAQRKLTVTSQSNLTENQQNELLRLRNEVSLLRKEKKKNDQLKETLEQSQAKLAQANIQDKQKEVQIQRNTCINNLRRIDAAIQQWALENNKRADDIPTEADLSPYMPNQKFPTCPAGGHYSIGRVDQPPTCSIPGHELSQNSPVNESSQSE